MQGLPTIRSYGDYASSNYGAHSLEVSVGALTVYFSYETPIAFETPQDGLVCSQNDWSTTTGKHLNWIQADKSRRLPREQFEAAFQTALKRYGLAS